MRWNLKWAFEFNQLSKSKEVQSLDKMTKRNQIIKRREKNRSNSSTAQET